MSLPVTAIAFVVTALTVHFDGRRICGYAPTAGQIVVVLAAVTAVTVVALSPLGRPLEPKCPDRQGVGHAWLVVGAVAATLLPAVFPPTWLGVVAELVVLLTAGVTIVRASTRRRWGAREIAALASGAIIGTTLLGFLNPSRKAFRRGRRSHRTWCCSSSPAD